MFDSGAETGLVSRAQHDSALEEVEQSIDEPEKMGGRQEQHHAANLPGDYYLRRSLNHFSERLMMQATKDVTPYNAQLSIFRCCDPRKVLAATSTTPGILNVIKLSPSSPALYVYLVTHPPVFVPTSTSPLG